MSNEAKPNSLAARLRVARERSGLSQEFVAAKLDLKRPAVSEIEAGRRKVKAEELAILADLYHVSVDWLLSEGATAPNKLDLAARGLARLAPEQLDQILELLNSLRDPKSKK